MPTTLIPANMSKAPLLPQHNDYRYGAAPPIRFPRANQNHARDSDSDRPAAPQGSSEEVRIPDWVSSLPPVNDQGKRVLHHSNPRDYGRLKKKCTGFPKLSRECLVSEIKCYGRYILITLLVFGLGGISFALWISGRQRV